MIQKSQDIAIVTLADLKALNLVLLQSVAHQLHGSYKVS